jgi:hypothetical protein
LVRV